MCKWRGLEHPFTHPKVAKRLWADVRSSAKPRSRISRKMVDVVLIKDLLDHLDDHCRGFPFDNAEYEALRLRAYRDRALLAMMFASDGRRRSEISNLMHSQILYLEAINIADPD